MKKIATIVFIFSIIIFWRNYSSKDDVSPSVVSSDPKKHVLDNVNEKLYKQIKTVNTKDDKWKSLTDFSLKAKDLLSKKNANEYFEIAQNSIPEMFNCLKKDYCGMEKDHQDDPYFDFEKTSAHIHIKRNLEIIKEALIINPELKNKLNFETLEQLANSEEKYFEAVAQEIQLSAKGYQESAISHLKKVAHFKAESRAEALVNISKKFNEEKNIILSEIATIFSTEKPHMVISVLEKMKSMNLKENIPTGLIESTLTQLCRFKTEESPNWLMIKFHATKIHSNFEDLCL